MKTLVTISCVLLFATLCFSQGYQYQYRNGENVYDYRNHHQGDVYTPQPDDGYNDYSTNIIIINPQQDDSNPNLDNALHGNPDNSWFSTPEGLAYQMMYDRR